MKVVKMMCPWNNRKDEKGPSQGSQIGTELDLDAIREGLRTEN
jgi:hypothetical protein